MTIKLDILRMHEWVPIVTPADHERDWMDQTGSKFAYRCLPLTIANCHGWVVRNPQAFSARWNGGISEHDSLEFRMEGQPVPHAPPPASVFGYGVLTFHIGAVFRTSPGWNLLTTGPFNDAKPGIAPLTGVMETDWSPYEFSVNWRFTEPNRWVRFECGEPYCMVFPVRREEITQIRPRIMPISADPWIADQRRRWSQSRDQFRADVMAGRVGSKPSDTWQQTYYRGLDMDDKKPIADKHQSKLRLHAPIMVG